MSNENISASLWECEEKASGFVEVPQWCEDITVDQVAAVLQGGCASGAYMPAVTYHEALTTMSKHGNRVLEYLEETDVSPGEVDLIKWSWSGLASHVLAMAVESWCWHVAPSLTDEVEAQQ